MSVIEQTWYESDYGIDDVVPVTESERDVASSLRFMTDNVRNLVMETIHEAIVSGRDNEELTKHLAETVNALSDAILHLDRVHEMPYETE